MGYLWSGYRKPRGQVIKRLRHRIEELELQGGIRAYRRYLEDHPEEWEHLDQLCNITISKFFRDRKMWDFLKDELLPKMLQANNEPFKAWSAGCCNGEEPYSLAIVIRLVKARPGRWKEYTILASDRNRNLLKRAEAGSYPPEALKELTNEERTFFLT